jgi:hypothetical protein
MFRPINSSESNLFTIRASIGYGSPAGTFGSTRVWNATEIIASNESMYPVTLDYLAAPTYNNLPSGFHIYYYNNGIFKINYGKTFTSQPCINVIPGGSTSNGFIATPYIMKTTLSYCNISFSSNIQTLLPSANGTNGLLGFDLIITGPVLTSVTTGNTNKGWELSGNINNVINSNPTSVYSYMDFNLGSIFNVPDSIIISKNLKLLGSDNKIKSYSTNSQPYILDYSHTVWTLGSGVNIVGIQPQAGMILIIIATGAIIAPSQSIQTVVNSFINYSRSTITFTTQNASVILYGTSSTNFVIIGKAGGLTLDGTVI